MILFLFLRALVLAVQRDCLRRTYSAGHPATDAPPITASSTPLAEAMPLDNACDRGQ